MQLWKWPETLPIQDSFIQKNCTERVFLNFLWRLLFERWRPLISWTAGFGEVCLPARQSADQSATDPIAGQHPAGRVSIVLIVCALQIGKAWSF
jgi:hypothetical protein